MKTRQEVQTASSQSLWGEQVRMALNRDQGQEAPAPVPVDLPQQHAFREEPEGRGRRRLTSVTSPLGSLSSGLIIPTDGPVHGAVCVSVGTSTTPSTRAGSDATWKHRRSSEEPTFTTSAGGHAPSEQIQQAKPVTIMRPTQDGAFEDAQTDLDGEDFHSDVFPQQLSLPDAAETPPGFDFQ